MIRKSSHRIRTMSSKRQKIAGAYETEHSNDQIDKIDQGDQISEDAEKDQGKITNQISKDAEKKDHRKITNQISEDAEKKDHGGKKDDSNKDLLVAQDKKETESGVNEKSGDNGESNEYESEDNESASTEDGQVNEESIEKVKEMIAKFAKTIRQCIKDDPENVEGANSICEADLMKEILSNIEDNSGLRNYDEEFSGSDNDSGWEDEDNIYNQRVIDFWKEDFEESDPDDPVVIPHKLPEGEEPCFDVKEYKEEEYINQEQLELLAARYPNVEKLTFMPKRYRTSNVPKLKFQNVKFLKLKKLTLGHIGLEEIHLTKENYPMMDVLEFEQTQGQIEYFKLDLPTLTGISFQHTYLGYPAGFAKSISRSRNLEWFSAHKLQGLGGFVHTLILPEVTSLYFHRCDDLESIRFYAPKLTSLVLNAVYTDIGIKILNPNDLWKKYDFLTILQRTVSKMIQEKVKCLSAPLIEKIISLTYTAPPWQPKKTGLPEPSKFSVNLVNSSASKSTIEWLRAHERVTTVEENLDARPW